MEGQYGCIISLHFARMAGDGPKARELVAQSGALRTLVGLGDRRVADMAAARADAIDAAPSGSLARALREDVAPGLQATNEPLTITTLKRTILEVFTSLGLLPEAAQVNINSSARHNADLRTINVPVPRRDLDVISLCEDTLLVTMYLTQKFATTDLDEMVQKHAISGFRPRFSESLKASKMASAEDSGETMLYSGQIGRAQPRYVKSDRALMDTVWERLTDERRRVVRQVQERLAAWATRAALSATVASSSAASSTSSLSAAPSSTSSRSRSSRRISSFHPTGTLLPFLRPLSYRAILRPQ